MLNSLASTLAREDESDEIATSLRLLAMTISSRSVSMTAVSVKIFTTNTGRSVT